MRIPKSAFVVMAVLVALSSLRAADRLDRATPVDDGDRADVAASFHSGALTGSARQLGCDSEDNCTIPATTSCRSTTMVVNGETMSFCIEEAGYGNDEHAGL